MIEDQVSDHEHARLWESLDVALQGARLGAALA
jgi:hypothetical protein